MDTDGSEAYRTLLIAPLTDSMVDKRGRDGDLSGVFSSIIIVGIAHMKRQLLPLVLLLTAFTLLVTLPFTNMAQSQRSCSGDVQVTYFCLGWHIHLAQLVWGM